MALKDNLVIQALQKVRNIASNISGKINDNQGWFRQGKFTPVQQTKDYFNPTFNNGNNFWSTPVAKGLSNIQQFNQKIGIEDPSLKFAQPFAKYGNQTLLAGQTALSVPLQKIGINYSPNQNLINRVQNAGMLNQQGGIGGKELWNTVRNTGNVMLKTKGLFDPKSIVASTLGSAAISPVIQLGTNIYNKNKKDFGLGNINLANRPKVKNPDGSISTIRSMSFNENGKEVLIPTVINGRIVSDEEAINHYRKSGEYLGKFDSVEEANSYAEQLHKEEEMRIKPITEGVFGSVFSGAITGFGNAGTTSLTNSLVNKFANFVPILKPLTDQAIQKGLPVAGDAFKEALKKWALTAGKRLIKAAVLETAVETPIWASITQGDKEKYLEALQREAVENLVMNVGMAGVQVLGDTKSLAPIVKNSIDTAVNKYMTYAGSSEGLKAQGGYIDMLGVIRDGTARTQDFDNARDILQSNDPKITKQQKIEAQNTIDQLGRQMFSQRQYNQLTTGINRDPENLMRAVADKIESDIKTNKGYADIPNLKLQKQLGAIRIGDDKGFPQQPRKSQLEPKIEGVIGTPPKTAPSLRSGVDKAVSTDQLPPTKVRKIQPVSSKASQAQSSITRNSTPEEVAQNLPNRINGFIEKTLGYSTNAPEGGERQAGLWTRTLRKGQEAISTKVEQGLGSENLLIRNAASTMQNFFRGLGMSPERAGASADLRGGMATANERAFNVMESLYKSLDNDKGSLERINAVLDPELSKTKVSFNDLTLKEKQVYNLIREGLDIVHDISYANGHISAELYAKNKGKYVPRLYEVTELPPEVDSFIKQGRKLDNSLYKQRGETTEWKVENNLNDPVYALGKRLAQVETNTAIKKYTDFLADNPRFVSDTEKAGFTKLSDSKAYGNLAGKYVLNSAVEDLKGFFFSNQAINNLYDVFRSYDRMGIRQLQKQLLTVFNPTTNVGNIVSDQVFGFVTGVDPLTLNKNLLEFRKNPSAYKQYSDYLRSKNIIGTDITRTDFVDKMGRINSLVENKKPRVIKVTADKVRAFYGGTDEVYKTSAFKALLDKGFTLEEATRKVADGFQNYSNVGKFYDLAAKTPIVGKPFIKFQGDLIRIIKNGAVNNPLGLITFLGILWSVARISSKLSGESDEDRETRENRFAAPMIPGLNIPLTWQTPIGEINIARYISPFYANNETSGVAGNMIPFFPEYNKGDDMATTIAKNANDPLLSPLVQAGVNRDFRGKRIADPNETKWQQSTLTPSEQLGNKAKFVGRAYLPPPVNSLIDVRAALQGNPNMYGTPQTVGQAVARLGGVKISQYGPEELQKIREKDAYYSQKGNEAIQQQINSVTKQQLKGEITPQQAEKRIKYLEGQMKQVNTSLIKGSQDSFSYINDNGNLATIDLTKYDDINKLPTTNRYETAIRESKQYTEAGKIIDNIGLSQEQKTTALKRLGISVDDARYYSIANDNNNLKTLYLMDSVDSLINRGASRREVIDLLLDNRKEINGNMVASSGVLNNLVDEGLITKEEAKEIKKYKVIEGKLTKTTSKSGTRVKKPKAIKVSFKKPKQVKVKALKTIKMPKPKALKIKKPKKIKLKKPKKIRVKKIA